MPKNKAEKFADSHRVFLGHKVPGFKSNLAKPVGEGPEG
jgi:hypothetical protein